MSRTGRPREFDRQEALRQAMELFWAQGYEGTTLVDLQKAMGGITAPSFYAAFGSKEALFRESVSLYAESAGSGIVRALSEGETARDSVGAMFREVVSLVSGTRTPKGCLIVLGGINCSPANSGVADFLRELRRQRAETIRSRLKRGVLEGNLPTGADVNGLAEYITTVIDGICLQAKDGASRKKLIRTTELAMSAFGANVSAE